MKRLTRNELEKQYHEMQKTVELLRLTLGVFLAQAGGRIEIPDEAVRRLDPRYQVRAKPTERHSKLFELYLPSDEAERRIVRIQ